MYITIGGVDVSSAYQGRSLKATEKTGTDWTSFRFTLENPAAQPQGGQEVHVWDSSDQRMHIAAGRIKRPGRQPKAADTNGDPVFRFEVQCAGWVADLVDRPDDNTKHVTKTTGFIARFIGSQVPGLSIAGVTTGGRTLPEWSGQHEKLDAMLSRLAKIEGRTWWIDLDRALHFEVPGETLAPFSLTDANWKAICGLNLKVEPDESRLANYIKLFYKGRYTEGTVKVYNASNEITGVGTSWLSHVTPGAKFHLEGVTDVSYTVEKVISDTTIRLSSQYGEVTDDTGTATYVFEEIPRATARKNLTSIAAVAALTGGDGIKALILNGPATSMSYQEALDYLLSELEERGNAPVNITIDTNSRLVTGELHAGMSVPISLTNWGGIDTVLPIRQLEIRDTGSADADGYPVFEYEIRMETYLYDLASRLRRLEEKVTADAAAADFVDDIFTDAEQVKPTEVFGVLSPIAPSTAEEQVKPQEALDWYEPARWAPFVWGPSVKAWTSQADWLTWSLTGMAATAGGDLEIGAGLLTGSGLSPWVIQYSPNSAKAATLTATIPAGGSVVVEWRSSDDQASASAWFTDLASVPDAKYIQSRVTATRLDAGDALAIAALEYTPHKSVLNWSYSTWGGTTEEFDTQAEWETWALVNLSAADAPGSLVLSAGQDSGTATSPWIPIHVRTVAMVATVTEVLPADASITWRWRTSPDGTDTSASAWFADLERTPHFGFLQGEATLTKAGADGPELQKLVLSPV